MGRGRLLRDGRALTRAGYSGWDSQRQLGELMRRVVPGDAIAARAVLPSGYRANAITQASDEVLYSLVIEGDAAHALRAGETEQLITLRAPALARQLQVLVDRYAAPGSDSTTARSRPSAKRSRSSAPKTSTSISSGWPS